MFYIYSLLAKLAIVAVEIELVIFFLNTKYLEVKCVDYDVTYFFL